MPPDKPPRINRKHDIYEWGGLTVFILLAFIVLSNFQQSFIHHHKHGDAPVYMQMARQSQAGEQFSQRAPFVYRPLTSWLAGALAPALAPILAPRPAAAASPTPIPFFLDPAFVNASAGNAKAPSDSTKINALTGNERHLVASFKLIAIVSGVLTVYLVLLFLRFFIRDWRLRLALALLYLLHWKLAMRYGFWLPINTDNIAVLCLTALMVLCQQARVRPHRMPLWVVLSAAAMAVGVLTRSSFIIYVLMLPLCVEFSPKAQSMAQKAREVARQFTAPLFVLPLCAGLAAFFYVRHIVDVTGVYGEEIHGSGLLWAIKIAYARPIGGFFNAIYTYWGPLVILLVWRHRIVTQCLLHHWHFALVLLFSLALCLAADPRLLSYAFPLYLALVGIVIQTNPALLGGKKWILIALLIAQLITQRVFWGMPTEYHGAPWLRTDDTPLAEPFLFTPFTSEYDYWDTWTLGTSRGFYFEIVVTQQLVLSLIALFFLSYGAGRKNAESEKSKNNERRG